MKFHHTDIHGATQALEIVRSLTGNDLILSICSECHEFIGAKAGHGNFGISHGYCPDCKENLLRTIRKDYDTVTWSFQEKQKAEGEILK